MCPLNTALWKEPHSDDSEPHSVFVCVLKYTEDQEKQEQVCEGICILKNKTRCKQILMKDSSARMVKKSIRRLKVKNFPVKIERGRNCDTPILLHKYYT